MKRVSGHLTYANVMATVAVFIALGGASYAAIKLPKNSVGAKQLKKGAVTGAKIKDGAITARKFAKGAVGGTTIDVKTLGTVPSAATAVKAGDAETVGGQTAAQIVAASKLHCAAGMVLSAGFCIELTTRPATEFLSAQQICAAAGEMIPLEASVLAFFKKQGGEGVVNHPLEWVGQSLTEGKAETFGSSNFLGGFSIEQSFRPTSESHVYRCAVPPSN